MNKKTWFIVGAAFIVVLLLAFGGIYLQYSKNAPVTTKSTITVQKPTGTQTATTKGSILDLLSGNKNVQCDITYPNNAGSGTVYVSGKKFNGNFTIKDASGKEVNGYTISDGTYVYIWSAAIPMGVKMKIEQAVSTASQPNQSVNINQQVDLKCSSWIPDNSKFIPPTNVTFTTVSGTTSVTPIVNPTTSAASGQTLCDQLTNPTAKAACLQALQKQGQ